MLLEHPLTRILDKLPLLDGALFFSFLNKAPVQKVVLVSAARSRQAHAVDVASGLHELREHINLFDSFLGVLCVVNRVKQIGVHQLGVLEA
jgi:hypothetical protein